MSNQSFIQNEYDVLSASYDKRWMDYLRFTHDMVFRLFSGKEPSHFLDAAGGTGVLVERLMERFPASFFTLTDLSAGMVHVARERFSSLSNVSVFLSDVHALPFNDGQFSGVTSVSAVHYFNDPLRAFIEFFRVLEPGGELILVDWCRDPFYAKIFDYHKRTFDPAHVQMYTVNELCSFVERAGFVVEKQERSSFGWWPLMGLRCRKI